MSAHSTPRGPEDTAQLAHAVLAKLNAFKADSPSLGEVRGCAEEMGEAQARVRVSVLILAHCQPSPGP